jgi:Glycosyltransferases involved in cell wall biogenesis
MVQTAYKTSMNTVKFLTVIVPLYNEQQNILPLYMEIRNSLEPLGKDWDVLFVDDGSTDASLDVIKRLAGDSEHVSYLAFAANRGQSAAFAAGFQAARGEVVITIDADLQNDPADIPAMLRRFEEGNDMVIGWRAKRMDSRAKRLASRWANAIRNALTNENVIDTGCSLKIMRADMARSLPMFTGMHRFLPTLMKLEGARVDQMQVNHRPRLHGESKYKTFGRAKTAVFDLFAVMWMQRRHIAYSVKEQAGTREHSGDDA